VLGDVGREGGGRLETLDFKLGKIRMKPNEVIHGNNKSITRAQRIQREIMERSPRGGQTDECFPKANELIQLRKVTRHLGEERNIIVPYRSAKAGSKSQLDPRGPKRGIERVLKDQLRRAINSLFMTGPKSQRVKTFPNNAIERDSKADCEFLGPGNPRGE